MRVLVQICSGSFPMLM